MAIMRGPGNIVRGSFPGTWRLAKRLLGRYRTPGPQLWKQYNVNQIQRLESALNQNGWSLGDFSSILDFGCGPGRMTQHLCWLASNAQIFGCDIDPDAVIEAQRLCPKARFHANDPSPPLAFDNGEFDLVCSFQVFTNISEASHQVWLKELARVLRPGGVMLSTTHSEEYLKRVSVFSPEYLQKYNFPGSVEEFIQLKDGYYYVSPDHWPQDYGFAVISKEYVTTRWPDYTGLPLVAYTEAAFETYPEGCQDIVIMAKDPIKRHFDVAKRQ